MTELAVPEPGPGAAAAPQLRDVGLHHVPRVELTREQIELLKRTYCKGATDDELALFVQVCEQRRLHPMAGHIHAVKRRARNPDTDQWEDTLSFQVSIDGFRLIAERSGHYGGQLGPWWCGDDGLWHEVWLADTPPKAAKVGVIRRDWAHPKYAVAHYREYVQTTRQGGPNRMWESMPRNQIAKCAEALALRTAFPEDLGGLYTDDEMGQAENEAQTAPPPAAPAPAPAPARSAPPAATPPPVVDGHAAPPPQPAPQPAATAPATTDTGAAGGGAARQEPLRFPSVVATLDAFKEYDAAYPWGVIFATAATLLYKKQISKFGDLETAEKVDAHRRLAATYTALETLHGGIGVFPPPTVEQVQTAFAQCWDGLLMEIPNPHPAEPAPVAAAPPPAEPPVAEQVQQSLDAAAAPEPAVAQATTPEAVAAAVPGVQVGTGGVEPPAAPAAEPAPPVEPAPAPAAAEPAPAPAPAPAAAPAEPAPAQTSLAASIDAEIASEAAAAPAPEERPVEPAPAPALAAVPPVDDGLSLG